MNTTLIVSPIAGAIIGYFTNYVAVKMLFRPYNEIKILGIKLPFTPGLIPKEKRRISKALGNAVGDTILTDDTITDYMIKPEMVDYISKIVRDISLNSRYKNITINNAGKRIFGDNWDVFLKKVFDCGIDWFENEFLSENTKDYITEEIYKNIVKRLDTKVGSIDREKILNFAEYSFSTFFSGIFESGKAHEFFEKAIWNFILSKQSDNRKISDIASFSAVAEFKDYISLKVPDAANYILSLTENEQIEEFLKSKLSDILKSVAGPIVSMFVDEDSIYCNIIENLTEYFNNTENSNEIENVVGIVVDKLAEKTIGDLAIVVAGQLRENSINRFMGFVFDEINNNILDGKFTEIFNDFIDKNMNLSAMDILLKADNEFDKKIKSYIYELSGILFDNINLNNEYVFNLFKKFTDTEIFCLLDKFGISEEKIIDFVKNGYIKFIKNIAPGFIKNLNTSHIVEEKINNFDMKFTEELILSITKKELSAITYFGGVLGFVIGIVPAVLSNI